MSFPTAAKFLVAHQPFWSKISILRQVRNSFGCPNIISFMVFVWMTLNKWLSVLSFGFGHELDAPDSRCSVKGAQWRSGSRLDKANVRQSGINPG